MLPVILVPIKRRLDVSNHFIPWQDEDILVGSDWHEQIQAAIKASDFGLLLISPDWLTGL